MQTIQLTRGKTAIIDDIDFQKVSRFKWYANKWKVGVAWYAFTNGRVGGKKRPIAMHRIILDAKKGQKVDHRDRDGLNNRRENLRFATHAQNMHNSRFRGAKSGFKGVFRSNSQSSRWQAMITFNRKKLSIGLFKTKEEAARAYDLEAQKLHGEFACTNKMLGLIL